MVILHIAPTPFFSDRGCHIRILGEIRALQENGVSVILSTYHLGKNVKNLETFRTIKIPWYNKLDVGGSWHKLYIDFFLLLVSIRLVIKYKPALLHGHLHEGAVIAKLVSWICSFGKIPVVFDIQGSLTGELKTYGMLNNKGILNKIFFSVEKLICRLPNYIVCSSNSNKKFIIDKMKIPSHKVSELIDGIYSDYFKDINKEELKKSLGINKEKIVVYSGSLLSSKGINYLIEAVPKILDSYSNVKFLIIGYPVDEIKTIAEKLKIDKSIIFLGRVDYFKLPEYLSISDIAVDPKVDKAGEGSGKIVNYMGAGLPVVCFDSRNNRNFLEANGIFAKSMNPDDLANKVLSLLKDEVKSKELGVMNKKRANEIFTWKAKGKNLLNIYNRLLS